MAYTTIDDPSAYFNTLLYSGNAGTNALTNSANAGDFQPDWLWIKCRNSAVSHQVFDTSRQTSGESTLVIRPNSTDAESNVSGDGMTSIDSNGFTLNGNGAGGGMNESGKTYVAWQWKANGGTTASNTDGSITSTVQANTTAGFSIVTYTGTGSNATVGHGLGSAPTVLIVKNRSSAQNWMVGHKDLPSGFQSSVFLDLTAAKDTDVVYFNNTAPTSTVFSIGTNSKINNSGENIVVYAFAEKQGYSKFGSYTGTGGGSGLIDSGPFIYTGFKPAFYIFKKSDSADDWYLIDNKRDPFNISDLSLFPNLNNAESDGGGSYNGVDFLSNGIKIRNGNSSINASGVKYIYIAFAEFPFVSSEGVPVTAR